ncbi:MAG: lysylphosphatidylglycerol synthase transmembrane domain-containing protein [Synechococcus sp. ELA057]
MLGKRLIYTLIALLVLYSGLGLWSGSANLHSYLIQLPIWWWLAAPTLVILGHGLLIQRWQIYLRHLQHPLSWKAGARIYSAGLALIAAPGRSGEALRGLWLQRRHSIPVRVGVGITLAERLTDLAGALLVLSWGLGRQVWLAVLIAFLALGGGSWLLTHPRLLRKLETSLDQIPLHSRWHGQLRLLRETLLAFAQVRQLMKPRPLLVGTALSSLCWLLEAGVLLGTFTRLGHPLSLTQTAVIRTATGLGGVVSLLPAGLGTSEATAIGLAMAYGATRGEALAATLVLRFATLVVPCAVGITSLLVQTDLRNNR